MEYQQHDHDEIDTLIFESFIAGTCLNLTPNEIQLSDYAILSEVLGDVADRSYEAIPAQSNHFIDFKVNDHTSSSQEVDNNTSSSDKQTLIVYDSHSFDSLQITNASTLLPNKRAKSIHYNDLSVIIKANPLLTKLLSWISPIICVNQIASIFAWIQTPVT